MPSQVTRASVWLLAFWPSSWMPCQGEATRCEVQEPGLDSRNPVMLHMEVFCATPSQLTLPPNNRRNPEVQQKLDGLLGLLNSSQNDPSNFDTLLQRAGRAASSGSGDHSIPKGITQEAENPGSRANTLAPLRCTSVAPTFNNFAPASCVRRV